MIDLTSILYEATRYKKETGENLPRWQEQLLDYEKQGGYFIHFSNFPRMGLYIVNKYSTPIGFYGYVLDREKMADFAVDRPYALIFKPKPEANVLELGRYTESDFQADVEKLIELGYTREDIEAAAEKAEIKSPAGRLWSVTMILSGSNKLIGLKRSPESIKGGGPTGKWTDMLLKLGYDGINDDCLSIIHYLERCQAVFFKTNKLELVTILDLKGKNIKNKEDLFTPKPEVQTTENNETTKQLTTEAVWEKLLNKLLQS